MLNTELYAIYQKECSCIKLIRAIPCMVKEEGFPHQFATVVGSPPL